MKGNTITTTPVKKKGCDKNSNLKKLISSIRRRNDLLERSSAMGEDTIAEIFMWLPLKSLLKFKSLSKRWFYLISDKDSYFHDRYISTMGIRNRKRIVGRENSNPNPIMLGFIFQNCWQSNPNSIMLRFILQNLCLDKYREPEYLPTSVELLQYTDGDHVQNHFNNNDPDRQAPASAANKSSSCPPFTLDRPTDFLLHYLEEDDYDISVVGSSNGFLLCSLPGGCNYLLANPITKEFDFLPKTKNCPILSDVSFVCKGDYPHLASVEYTIVIVGTSKPDGSPPLWVEVLYNGDEDWRQFDITTSGPPFGLECWRINMVMITTSDQGRGTETTTLYTPCYHYLKVLSFELEKKKLMTRDDERQQLVGTITELPKKDVSTYICYDSRLLEEVDGSLHFLHIYSTNVDGVRLEVWVLKDNKEWYLKHKVYMGNMIREAQWINPKREGIITGQWTVEGIHPLNRNLILLTIFQNKVWYNVDTQTIELVADFYVQNFRYPSNHFAYQWPCWPPLL